MQFLLPCLLAALKHLYVWVFLTWKLCSLSVKFLFSVLELFCFSEAIVPVGSLGTGHSLKVTFLQRTKTNLVPYSSAHTHSKLNLANILLLCPSLQNSALKLEEPA